jgi:hypothetical protein
MFLSKIRTEIYNNHRLDIGIVNAAVTELYSTEPLIDFRLTILGQVIAEGECQKLYDNWYKLKFFINDQVIPFYLNHWCTISIKKVDNLPWDSNLNIFAALTSKINNFNRPEHYSEWMNNLFPIYNYKIERLNKSYVYLTFIKGFCSVNNTNIFNRSLHQEHETTTNFFRTNICWTDMNNNDYAEWFKNNSGINNFTNVEQLKLPGEPQKYQMLRIKQRQDIFLEELMQKVCHPKRLNQIDNHNINLDNYEHKNKRQKI